MRTDEVKVRVALPAKTAWGKDFCLEHLCSRLLVCAHSP
jgi:hypothetical protein